MFQVRHGLKVAALSATALFLAACGSISGTPRGTFSVDGSSIVMHPGATFCLTEDAKLKPPVGGEMTFTKGTEIVATNVMTIDLKAGNVSSGSFSTRACGASAQPANPAAVQAPVAQPNAAPATGDNGILVQGVNKSGVLEPGKWYGMSVYKVDAGGPEYVIPITVSERVNFSGASGTISYWTHLPTCYETGVTNPNHQFADLAMLKSLVTFDKPDALVLFTPKDNCNSSASAQPANPAAVQAPVAQPNAAPATGDNGKLVQGENKSGVLEPGKWYGMSVYKSGSPEYMILITVSERVNFSNANGTISYWTHLPEKSEVGDKPLSDLAMLKSLVTFDKPDALVLFTAK